MKDDSRINSFLIDNHAENMLGSDFDCDWNSMIALISFIFEKRGRQYTGPIMTGLHKLDIAVTYDAVVEYLKDNVGGHRYTSSMYSGVTLKVMDNYVIDANSTTEDELLLNDLIGMKLEAAKLLIKKYQDYE